MKKYTAKQVIMYALFMWVSGVCLGIGSESVVDDIRMQYKYYQESSECVAGYIADGFERSDITVGIAGVCWVN